MADGRSGRHDARDEERRRADHAAIDRLAGELVRALAARLETTGMAEIEVSEGGGRVRVRRVRPGQASVVPDGAGRGSARVLPSLVAVGPGAMDGGGARQTVGHGPDPGIATSPAVGYFSPRDGIGPGVAVTVGERLGAVDMLGVSHEVAAPIDGIVFEVLVEPGQAVEYGQGLVTVERPGAAHADVVISEA